MKGVLMLKNGVLLILVLSTLLAACGGTGALPGGPTGPGPGGPVPNELVGDWYTGTISNIQFYDPVTGSWADTNGQGYYFIFNPDGTYEEGAVINSTSYNCSFRLMGRAVGTFTATADTLTLYQQERRTKVADTCSGVGENVKGPETIAYSWSLGADEYGNEGLSLWLSDGSLYGTFYPWGE